MERYQPGHLIKPFLLSFTLRKSPCFIPKWHWEQLFENAIYENILSGLNFKVENMPQLGAFGAFYWRRAAMQRMNAYFGGFKVHVTSISSTAPLHRIGNSSNFSLGWINQETQYLSFTKAKDSPIMCASQSCICYMIDPAVFVTFSFWGALFIKVHSPHFSP